MKSLIHICFFCIFFSTYTSAQQNTEPVDYRNFIHYLNQRLSNVILVDGFNPPQASRVYCYPNIAVFEALRNTDTVNYKSLSGVIKHLNGLPQPVNSAIDFNLASVIAFQRVAQFFVYRANLLDDIDNVFIKISQSQKNDSVAIQHSIEYGNLVAEKIIAWAKNDNFIQLKTFTRYKPLGTDYSWEPTPPAYYDALEPNWRHMRPMFMDSSSQFKPAPPLKFDTLSGSAFFTEAMEVYNTVKKNDSASNSTAYFWDDNPLRNWVDGHFSYVTKKLSPGGHWINICSIVTKREKFNALRSAQAFALVSIGLFDGFISCWDEKFRSNLIRPETYINKYIDREWSPFLETPPFPEHTSGHSVISSSAAEILTSLVGDNYHFTDSTEFVFGFGVRTFNSFREAANQAGWSRLYGGIHYSQAISVGLEQGKAIGRNVITKIKHN
ncbi:MAG: vanadium-dependent haloperoxidase [Bacteroidia bacterium]